MYVQNMSFYFYMCLYQYVEPNVNLSFHPEQYYKCNVYDE